MNTLSATATSLIFALFVGIAIPVQAGVNGRLNQILGSPVRSSLVSFAVGLATVLGVCVVTGQFSGWNRTESRPWWVYTGGLLGAFGVTVMAVIPRKIGVSLTLSLVITGQLLAAVIIDHFGLMGYPVRPVSWMRIVGVLAIIFGSIMVLRS